MPGTSIEIKGRVIDNKTYAGIQNCSVELWKKLIIGNTDAVQITVSNTVITTSSGEFTISESVENIESYVFFVKVYKNGLLIKTTENEPFTQINTSNYDVSIDKVTDGTTRSVSGKVMNSDGTGLGNRVVKLFSKTFDKLTEIGTTTSSITTGSVGNYSITYNIANLSNYVNKDNTINLVVKLYNDANLAVEAVTTPVFFNNNKDLSINLVDSETPYKERAKLKTLAETLISKISDDMEAGTAGVLNATIFNNIKEDDIKYISEKSNVSIGVVSKFLQATNFGHTFISSTLNQDKVEKIYALVDEGFDCPEKIIFASNNKLKESIQKASNTNTIGSYTEGVINSFINELKTGIKTSLKSDTASDLGKVFDVILDAVNPTKDDVTKDTIIDTIVDYYNLVDQSNTSVYDQLILKTQLQDATINTTHVNKLKLVLDISHILGNLDTACSLIKVGYTKNSTNYQINSTSHLIDVLINPAEKDVAFAAITDIENEKKIVISNLEETIPHICFNKKLQYDSLNSSLFDTSTIKIKTFLINNPEFDLGKDISEQFGTNNGLVNLNSLNENQIEILKEELPKLQRLFSIAPNTNKYEIIKGFYDAEIYSAASITNMGEDNFINNYANIFGNVEEKTTINSAKTFFHKALLQSTKAMLLWTKYGKDFNTVSTEVFNANKFNNTVKPDLAQLFGMVDYCSCSKCRSVLSPAAYLADLLAFLKEIKVGNSNLFDNLLSRRPDLEHILLDCNNSNTPVPTIDLVNEILLCAVAGIAPIAYQTTFDAETLKAIPEHDKELDSQAAFNNIKNNSYPWSLPFDYPLEEYRTYCKQLGITKYHLMELFYKKVENSYATHSALDIATEYLGFYTNEINKIVNLSDLPALYGSTIWSHTAPYFYNNSSATFNDLCNVKLFLDYSGITYEDLNKLLQSYFINPGSSGNTNRIKIVFLGETGTYHLKDAFFATYNGGNVKVIDTALTDFLSRLYKFRKIQSKLGLSVKELDLIINAYFSINDKAIIDNGFFIMMADLFKVKERTNLSIEELLVFYLDFNTTYSYKDEESLYNKLFQNPVYSKPIRTELASNSQTPESLSSDVAKSDIKPLLRSIMRLSEADFEYIILKEALTMITVQSLSLIYRINLFSKVLGINIQEYYQLKDLAQFDSLNCDPMPISYIKQAILTKVPPCNTLKCFDSISVIKKSGFSIADLSWLLHNDYSDSTKLSVEDSVLSTEILKIGNELTKIVKECKVNLDGFKSFVIDDFSEFLTLNITASDKNNFKSIVANVINFFDGEIGVSILSPAEIGYLSSYFGDFFYVPMLPDLPGAEYLHLAVKTDPLYIEDVYLRYKYIIQCRNIVLCEFNAANIEKYLSNYVSQDNIKDAMDLISGKIFRDWTDGATPVPSVEIKDKIKAKMEAIIDNDFQKFLTQNAYDDATATSAMNNAKSYLLYGGTAYMKNQIDRYIYVINDLMLASIKKSVTTEITKFLSIDEEITKLMLEKYMEFSFNGIQKSNQVLFDSVFINSIKTQSEDLVIDNHKKVLLRLYKASLFIKKYEINPTNAAILYDHYVALNCLNIYSLPFDMANKASFIDWKTFDKYFELNNKYFGNDSVNKDVVETGIIEFKPSLFDVIYDLCETSFSDQTKIDKAIADIALSTTWDASDIKFIALTMKGNNYSSSNASLRNLLISASFLNELTEQINIAYIFRIAASSIVDINLVEPTSSNCSSLRQVLKEKYGVDQWLKIYTPASNIFREKLRDALIAYLTGHVNILPYIENNVPKEHNIIFKDALSIYDYFLIDPLVGVEPTTSRIKQAGLTIQLFVQRILMNLEDNLSMDFRHQEEWKWRKNYRVWEANRKVFLFPENWLEPELRMDKSYFFKEMESELLQDEVTKEKVEQAYLSYLEKMQETANFEIVGSYLDRGDGENDLHVIARTKSYPHVYYYRKYEEMLYWKPWEKMDVEIDGNHIVPVVWNRQLYVFWLKYTGGASGESTDLKRINDPEYTLPQPKSNLKINLAWSCFKNGKWEVVNVSKEDYTLTDESHQLWSMDRKEDLIFLPYNDNIKDITTNTVYNVNPSPDCLAFSIYIDINDQCWPLLLAEFSRDAVVNFKRVDFLLYNILNTNGVDKPRYLNDSYVISGGKNRWDERKDIICHSSLNNKFYLDIQDYYKFDGVVSGSEVKYKYNNPLNDADFPYKLFYNEIRKVSKNTLPNPPEGIPFGQIIPGKGEGVHLLPGQMINGKGDGGVLPGMPIPGKGPISQLPHGTYEDYKYQAEKTTIKKEILQKISKPTFISISNNDFICSMKSINRNQTNLKQVNDLKHLFIETESKIFFGRVSSIPTYVRGNINISEPIGGLLMSGGRNLNPNGGLVQMPMDNLPLDNSNQNGEKSSEKTLFFGKTPQNLEDSPEESGGLSVYRTETKYWFQTFYHPFIPIFIKQLRKYGIDGLLNPDYKETPELCRQTLQTDFDFIDTFSPVAANVAVYGKYLPIEDIDFSASGPYSIYNWEIFFHAPLTVADRLSQNRQFEDAQKWFHYIFDPTDTNPNFTGNARFWKIKPFALLTDLRDMQDLMYDMSENHGELEAQIQLWRNDPFNPHLIAQFRHLAYMKSVVMKYLDNLLAWGDDLFTQDTMESINEAVQIYILAAHILGRRPVIIEKPESEAKSFFDIKDQIDAFSNAIVDIENYISVSRKEKKFNNRTETVYVNGKKQEITASKSILPMVDTAESILTGRKKTSNGTGFILATIYKSLYFGIPFNDKLLTYWDGFEDRLFKIRHSMNIKGIKRQLALYEPPIDPGLLIKAKAAGLDITQALNALQSPLPYYRFRVMLQKAQELCNDIKGFGSVLLSALEKKDAEALSLTRAVQEKSLLSAVKSIKQKSIEEAQKNIDATSQSIINTEKRRDSYRNREYKIANEKLHLEKLREAKNAQLSAQAIQSLSGILALIPNFTLSIGTDSSSKTTLGGGNICDALNSLSGVFNMISSFKQYTATNASIEAGYQRRQEEWDLQIDLADWEMEQINKQLLAAQVRLEIAKTDLENHELQMQHSEDNYEFMKSKYTNAELYNWMITQTSNIYFEMYQFAVKLAKQAERCMLFELGVDSAQHTDIITYGHWDNLKKGLFAGDKLQYELRLLENFYMENNERQFEITKNVSLAMLNANALMELKTNGVCEFEVPEMLYDIDYPGMYMRRIKSVSITIPASTGPYTNVACKLSMINNRYRNKTSLVNGYAHIGIDETRFVQNIVGIQSIATSSAQNDKGMFEFNFNDERYLPFEGAGAIGRWQIELPDNFRQFDYKSISDAILHISYTAKDAGGLLKEAAIKNLKDNLNQMLDELSTSASNLMLPIEMKATYADEFYQLTKTSAGQTGVNFKLTQDMFPDFVRDYIGQVTTKKIKVYKLNIFVKANESDLLTIGSTQQTLNLLNNRIYHTEFLYNSGEQVESGGKVYNLKLNTSTNTIENMWMIVGYKIETV